MRVLSIKTVDAGELTKEVTIIPVSLDNFMNSPVSQNYFDQTDDGYIQLKDDITDVPNGTFRVEGEYLQFIG